LLTAAAVRLAGGEGAERVARGFHETYCRLAADLAHRVFGGITSIVALGGGCFVNRILLRRLTRLLRGHGFTVLTPGVLPPGDGGIAFGQAVLAASGLARQRRILFDGDQPCV
jgi:hydrogenase maturation protein HypF